MKRGPKVVELSETDAYKRGCHHGEECREEIPVILDAWKRHLSQRFGALSGRIRNALIKRFYSFAFKSSIPEDFRSEMRGIADAAGVKYRDIAFMNVFDCGMRVFLQRGRPVLSKVARRFLEEWEKQSMACSSFASRTNRGTVIAGYNLDEGIIEREFCRLVTIFIYKTSETAPRFMSIMVPGYVGVMRGMNEEGIFLGHNTCHVKDARRPGLPHAMLLRRALQERTLENTCRVITSHRRTIGSVILIGDAMGARVLELSARAHDVRLQKKSSIVCTNHFLTDTMQPYYRHEYTIPGMGFPEFFLDPKYTRYRFRRVSELLSQSLPETPEEVRKILEQVSNAMTVQSVVFDPQERAAYVAIPHSGFPPACRDCDLVKVPLERGAA